ncbi:MAG: hypothetical protein H0W19_11135 [Nitrosopumilus sp.]|nr:hypothetical protein [Nitrosopumilus sp.]
MTSFLYALKSSEAEAKRQYPARLMKIFDYLEIENNIVDSKNKTSNITSKFRAYLGIIFLLWVIQHENYTITNNRYLP